MVKRAVVAAADPATYGSRRPHAGICLQAASGLQSRAATVALGPASVPCNLALQPLRGADQSAEFIAFDPPGKVQTGEHSIVPSIGDLSRRRTGSTTP